MHWYSPLLLVYLTTLQVLGSAGIGYNLLTSCITSTTTTASTTSTGVNNDVTVRVRTSSGSVSRLVVSESLTVAELSQKLVDAVPALSVTENCTVSFHGDSYVVATMRTNVTSTVLDIKFTDGDVIDVKGIEVEASSTVRSSSSSTTNTQKKTTSITDIMRRKESMVKIKRQKADTSKTVRLSSETTRIFKRIRDKGGIALLLGQKHVKVTEADQKQQRRAPSSQATLTKQKPENVDVVCACELFLGPAASHSGSIQASGALIDKISSLAQRLKLDVVGCCIGLAEGEGGEAAKAWGADYIRDALGVFEKLHPTDISQAAIIGNPAEQKLVNNSFVILTVTSQTGAEVTSSGAPKGATFVTGGGTMKAKKAPKTAKKDKAGPKTAKSRAMAAPHGMSLEAFKLSDQAAQLHRMGVLAAQPPAGAAEKTDPSSSSGSGSSSSNSKEVGTTAATKTTRTAPKPHQRRTFGRNTGEFSIHNAKDDKDKGKGTGKDPEGEEAAHENIALASAVLLKNDEVLEVDSYLLSVPLPVMTLPLPAATKAKKEKAARTFAAAGAAKAAALLPPFEHTFPSAFEVLEGGEATTAQAKQYFVKLLRKISSKKGVSGSKCDVPLEVRNRLRDAQLLLYAYSVLDRGTLEALCTALIQDGAAAAGPQFPVAVAFSLEMVREALIADATPDED